MFSENIINLTGCTVIKMPALCNSPTVTVQHCILVNLQVVFKPYLRMLDAGLTYLDAGLVYLDAESLNLLMDLLCSLERKTLNFSKLTLLLSLGHFWCPLWPIKGGSKFFLGHPV